MKTSDRSLSSRVASCGNGFIIIKESNQICGKKRMWQALVSAVYLKFDKVEKKQDKGWAQFHCSQAEKHRTATPSGL